MTQWLMPARRSDMAMTAATAPAPVSPRDHSHSDSPPAESISSMMSA